MRYYKMTGMLKGKKYNKEKKKVKKVLKSYFG